MPKISSADDEVTADACVDESTSADDDVTADACADEGASDDDASCNEN